MDLILAFGALISALYILFVLAGVCYYLTVVVGSLFLGIGFFLLFCLAVGLIIYHFW